MSNLSQGLVQIYTGNGKGKTTAAFGLALRAVGHGFRVFIIQFMKGNDGYGELDGIKRLSPECQLEHYGGAGWVHKGENLEENIVEAKKAFSSAQEIIFSGDWDIVILDEILNAIWFELIPESEVMELLTKKPSHVELILTGRNASEDMIEKADLVTEMVVKKHPYEKGIMSRQGIEF
ncbi:cob(I)yrinic acid a,c-diamide adenosyltransferase [Desulfosporosinus sp.]|uniref:cob(I)yrinic acid a,c-diamide adenosyltransferase n=1 Tax=Desulfosporosinus sp. TaxID=157907 RepID=UPI002309172D|nr:cob(I)yrinic acid a,c-diamide adenosyltransferase [Desulfosporosinus sp.]MCO5386762.1 cob(I)yrinic acid a,c-diamide adenosyltransferase [Desulfosporosinus sp.]MDA8220304.1 cob(I)yrinic acid a,c-diamide adenosyltransferase [Desulfitobacterium hafniense]